MRSHTTIRRRTSATGRQERIVDERNQCSGRNHENHADGGIDQFLFCFGNAARIPTGREVQEPGIHENREEDRARNAEQEVRKIDTGLDDIVELAIASGRAVIQNFAGPGSATAGFASGFTTPIATRTSACAWLATFGAAGARTRVVDTACFAVRFRYTAHILAVILGRWRRITEAG